MGGGVQGDAAALSIAIDRNDVDVLLLLLQATVISMPWDSKDAFRLPLARLLTLPFSAVDSAGSIYSSESGSASAEAHLATMHWASAQASPQECLLLDRIAECCPYAPRQLHRAIEAAISAGLKEVSYFSLKRGNTD